MVFFLSFFRFFISQSVDPHRACRWLHQQLSWFICTSRFRLEPTLVAINSEKIECSWLTQQIRRVHLLSEESETLCTDVFV